MRLKTIHIRDFKRFTDLTITDLPEAAKLVVLAGPNGSGKSSLFEALNFWQGPARAIQYDKAYHHKITAPETERWDVVYDKLSLEFYGTSITPRAEPARARRAFYFRSPYRHEPDFSSANLARSDPILDDSRRPALLINTDARVADNYQRILSATIAALYTTDNDASTVREIRDRLIGSIRDAMRRVFPDLTLESVGAPQQDGTFLFTKGTSHNFRYKNLSGGEKAAFDLLLDFIIKAEEFNDTIICIDEPEAHINTRLQGSLLAELMHQLPTKCQLWIATHSIGMMHTAAELDRNTPGSVTFLDFADLNFDTPVTLVPASTDPAFWKRTFDVALGDLASLVAPEEIVFCEGRPELTFLAAGRTFDADVYRTIFGSTHSRTDFVPLGGTSELDRDAVYLTSVFTRLFPTIRIWTVIDRDDRSQAEIDSLRIRKTFVLTRRDLENYLWDDEILVRLCADRGQGHLADQLLREKQELLAGLPSRSHPVDDVKQIQGELYNRTKALLQLTACGNNAVEFAKVTLAPLITPDTNTYRELEHAVFDQASSVASAVT